MRLVRFVVYFREFAAGLILPPLGVIDGSVLMLSAQLLVLCATLLGVDGYYEKMKEILEK